MSTFIPAGTAIPLPFAHELSASAKATSMPLGLYPVGAPVVTRVAGGIAAALDPFISS